MGSEMCIRDRLFIQHIQQGFIPGIGFGKALQEGIPLLQYPGIGCLLYTSDAADDLLCVDLGGRRIINKKNKPHTAIQCRNTTQTHHT